MAILRKNLSFDFKKQAEQVGYIDPVINFSRASTATRINPTTNLVENVSVNTPRLNGKQELWKAGSKNLISYGNFDGFDFPSKFGSYFAVYNNGPETSTYNFSEGYNNSIAYTINWTTNTTTKGIYLGGGNSNLFKADGQARTWSFMAKGSGAPLGYPLFLAWNHAPDTIVAISNPNLTTEWQLYSFVITFNVGTTIDVNGFVSVTGINGAGSLSLCNLQLELGATNTGYEQNPIIIQPGLLIEGAATNLLLRSSDLTYPDWVKETSGTASAPIITAGLDGPLGSGTAFRMQANRGLGNTVNDYSLLAQFVTTQNPHSNSASMWIKSNTGSDQSMYFSIGAGLRTITVTPTWQRFYASNSNVVSASDYIEFGSRGVYSTTNSLDILIALPQLENGIFPSSYLSTRDTTVTRSADIATIDVSKIWNTSEGTIICEADFGPINGTYQTMLDGSSDNRFQVYRQSSGNTLINGTLGVLNLGTQTGRTRLAFSTKDYLKGSVNGGTVDTTARTVINPVSFKLGANSGNGEHLNGTIQSLQYVRYAMDDNTLKYSSIIK